MRKIMVLTILMVVNVWAIDVGKLEKAHEEALNVYQKDKSHYKAIDLLRKAGVQKILDQQPKGMSTAKYIHLLNDYGYFLSLTTKGNTYVRPNYCEAKKALEKVQQISPKRTAVYLNLGDLYWKMYRVDAYINSYNSKSARDRSMIGECFYRKDKVTYAYLAKQMYLKYEKRMIEANRKDKIPERIKFILKNNKVFVLIRDYWPRNRTTEFNPCVDYVNALNSLPEKERTYCNRDLSGVSEAFNLLTFDSLNEKTKKWFKRFYISDKGITFKFKDWFYFDSKYTLYERFKVDNNRYTKSCRYNFLNLTMPLKTHVLKYRCTEKGNK